MTKFDQLPNDIIFNIMKVDNDPSILDLFLHLSKEFRDRMLHNQQFLQMFIPKVNKSSTLNRMSKLGHTQIIKAILSTSKRELKVKQQYIKNSIYYGNIGTANFLLKYTTDDDKKLLENCIPGWLTRSKTRGLKILSKISIKLSKEALIEYLSEKKGHLDNFTFSQLLQDEQHSLLATTNIDDWSLIMACYRHELNMIIWYTESSKSVNLDENCAIAALLRNQNNSCYETVSYILNEILSVHNCSNLLNLCLEILICDDHPLRINNHNTENIALFALLWYYVDTFDLLEQFSNRWMDLCIVNDKYEFVNLILKTPSIIIQFDKSQLLDKAILMKSWNCINYFIHRNVYCTKSLEIQYDISEVAHYDMAKLILVDFQFNQHQLMIVYEESLKYHRYADKYLMRRLCQSQYNNDYIDWLLQEPSRIHIFKNYIKHS